MLFIDGTHLIENYGGTLLGVMGKDANDGFCHVAFTVVNNEMDANLTWFSLKLEEEGVLVYIIQNCIHMYGEGRR